MFICNLYLHRNRHDFQDGLPLIDFLNEAKDIEYANPIPAHGYINASLSENMSKTMVDCLIDVERKSRILKLK